MIQAAEKAIKENIRGGQGKAEFEYLLTNEQLGKSSGLFARITLHPNSSVGFHEHHGDNETYFIVSGQGRFNDNGTWKEVKSGDVLFTNDGEGHSLENTSNEPLVFMALILNG